MILREEGSISVVYYWTQNSVVNMQLHADVLNRKDVTIRKEETSLAKVFTSDAIFQPTNSR
jgi:hypothetical protein